MARITSSGPEPKRPPHMLLESGVRALIAFVLSVTSFALLAGCDRESAPKEQAQADAIAVDPAPAKTAPVSFGLESASGMKANLSYAKRGMAAPAVPFTGADGREVQLARLCRAAFAGQSVGDMVRAVQGGNADIGCAGGIGRRADFGDCRVAGFDGACAGPQVF